MCQRKLEKREKYLPYFFHYWTITYIYLDNILKYHNYEAKVKINLKFDDIIF